MRRTFSLIIFLLVLGIKNVFGATYYVSTTGSDSNDGFFPDDTHAWRTLSYAGSRLLAGDTLNILSGTYNEGLATLLAGTLGNRITVQAYDLNNKPIIRGVNIAHDYWIFDGLKITDTVRGIWLKGDHILIDRCEIYETTAFGIEINRAGATDIVIQRSFILDTQSQNIYISSAGTTLNFNYNVVSGWKAGTGNNILFYAVNSGTFNIYNNNFLNCQSIPVYLGNAGITAEVKNNIIAHYGLGNSGGVGLYCAAGSTVNYDYNLITCNALTHTQTVINGTDGGHNKVGTAYVPGFISYKDKGVVILTNDDLLADGEALAELAQTYGIPITLSIYWLINKDEENLSSRLTALVNNGHEIANHSRTHTDFTATAWGTLQYDGTGTNPTFEVNKTTQVITLNTTEQNDEVIISNIDTKTFQDFTEALAGTNWSYLQGGNSRLQTWLNSLADTGGAAALAGVPPQKQLTFNHSDFLNNEMGWQSFWLASQISGYTVKSTTYPLWSVNEAVVEGAIAAGMLAGRRGRVNTVSGIDLRYIYPYYLQDSTTSVLGDRTEAGLKNMVLQWVLALAGLPGVGIITTHGPGNPTLQEYAWLCEELNQLSDYVEVLTLGGLGEVVQNSGNWTDKNADRKIWTRTFVNKSDYNLAKNSPCIDSGMSVGLSGDILGNTIRGVPDIGAYEYQGTGQVIMIN